MQTSEIKAALIRKEELYLETDNPELKEALLSEMALLRGKIGNYISRIRITQKLQRKCKV